jgi:hypothetical protein
MSVMNSHGRPSNATQGTTGNPVAARLGHAISAWPLSYIVVVVVISVGLILFNGTG